MAKLPATAVGIPEGGLGRQNAGNQAVTRAALSVSNMVSGLRCWRGSLGLDTRNFGGQVASQGAGNLS